MIYAWIGDRIVFASDVSPRSKQLLIRIGTYVRTGVVKKRTSVAFLECVSISDVMPLVGIAQLVSLSHAPKKSVGWCEQVIGPDKVSGQMSALFLADGTTPARSGCAARHLDTAYAVAMSRWGNF